MCICFFYIAKITINVDKWLQAGDYLMFFDMLIILM